MPIWRPLPVQSPNQPQPQPRHFLPSTAHIVYDTFTDADATSVDAHTMDIGTGWTVPLTSSVTIRGNRARSPGLGHLDHAWTDSGISDCIIQCTIHKDDPTIEAGISARLTSANGVGLYCKLAGGNFGSITFRDNITNPVLATFTTSGESAVDYTHRVTLRGSSVIYEVIELPGAVCNITCNLNLTQTRHGIFSTDGGGSTYAYHDEFFVDAGPSAEAYPLISADFGKRSDPWHPARAWAVKR
jgi:hypothetical protein